MLICSHYDLVHHFITEIFAGCRFDFFMAIVLVDPRRSLNIHIQDRIVILNTRLPIRIEYGAPDIDPMHAAILMELPILTVWAGIS